MAKQGLTSATADGVLKFRANGPGWALCIGAGTSLPAFPSWQQLVRRLVRRDGGDDTVIALESYLSQFAPDAVLQAAADRLGMSDTKFAEILVEELYRDLRGQLSASEWRAVTRALRSFHVGQMKHSQWMEFIEVVDRRLAGVAAVGLAQTIAETIDTDLAPSAIVSFNAESLFVALLNAFVAQRRWNTDDPSAKSVIDVITHSISDRRLGRIPYYFCHGLLPVPGRAALPHGTSVDKLVFSEAKYLQLANNAFAWQSASFIDVCMSRSIVFVGVSLSDSNMRRWLSWVHATRVSELAELHGVTTASTTHYWLTREPGNPTEKRWIESTVAHLGVRVIWIPDWTDVPVALRRMLTLRPLPTRSVRTAIATGEPQP